jgi:hypothetical protein
VLEPTHKLPVLGRSEDGVAAGVGNGKSNGTARP